VKPYSSVNDLKAIYDIDTNWLSQALPFIKIDSQYVEFTYDEELSFRQDKIQRKGDSSKTVIVDLNSADTIELKSIPGIGSFYARQIVELRERYRGFRSFDQLLDLYKVSDETLTLLSEKSTIDTSAVRKIDLNTCTIEELGRHPYLSWKQARIIIAYRDQHDNFTSVKEILRTDVISDSVYLKIAPYLEVK